MKFPSTFLLASLLGASQTLAVAVPQPIDASAFAVAPPLNADEFDVHAASTIAKRNTYTGYTTGYALQKSMLKAHNAYRAHHGAGPVSWSSTLAKAALTQAKKCVFAHSDPYKYGENIAGGSSGYSNPAFFVYLWYSEVSDYDFDNPGYSNDVGHFTQLVWNSTKQIGCAWAVGCSGSTQPVTDNFLVCEYFPNGNILPDVNFAKNVFAPLSNPPLPATPSTGS